MTFLLQISAWELLSPRMCSSELVFLCNSDQVTFLWWKAINTWHAYVWGFFLKDFIVFLKLWNCFNYDSNHIWIWNAVCLGFVDAVTSFFEAIHYCILTKKKILRHVEEINVLSYENTFAFQKEYCVRLSSYWGDSKERRKKKIAWPYL